METESGWEKVSTDVRTHVHWAIASSVDALFISFWILITWAVSEYVVKPLELSGIDRWQLQVFQFLFAISTLVPIACWVLKDVAIMVLRSWRELRREYASGYVVKEKTEHVEKSSEDQEK